MHHPSHPATSTGTTSPEAAMILSQSRKQFLAFLEPRVGSRAEAEEILQTAFVKSLEKNGDFQDAESVTAWFYRVLRNALVDYYRRRGALHRAQERHAREPREEEWNLEIKRAVCHCIAGLLPALKPEHQAILHQVDLQDGTIEGAARELGITPGNGRVRLHRARRALRARVEECCGMCATHGCLDCSCKH